MLLLMPLGRVFRIMPTYQLRRPGIVGPTACGEKEKIRDNKSTSRR